jgi:hypothetical protein
MLSVERVARDCWFMLNRSGDVYEFYCASLFPAGKDSQLIIFDLCSNTTMTSLSFLEVSTEIYSTVFWSVAPEECAQNIVNRFIKCYNTWYPIELIYEYGGTLSGQRPVFASPSEQH